MIAKALIDQGMRLASLKWGLSFLGGPIGTILGFVFAPVLGLLITEGMLKVEFARITFRTKADEKRYRAAIDRALTAEGKLTPEEKAEFIREIKDATKDFISIRKYLKQS